MFKTIKQILTREDLDNEIERKPYSPPRRERRDGTRRKFRQLRHKRGGKQDYWEWKPTQTHPMHRRSKNRRRNAMAKASRKANR